MSDARQEVRTLIEHGADLRRAAIASAGSPEALDLWRQVEHTARQIAATYPDLTIVEARARIATWDHMRKLMGDDSA